MMIMAGGGGAALLLLCCCGLLLLYCCGYYTTTGAGAGEAFAEFKGEAEKEEDAREDLKVSKTGGGARRKSIGPGVNTGPLGVAFDSSAETISIDMKSEPFHSFSEEEEEEEDTEHEPDTKQPQVLSCVVIITYSLIS